MKVNPISAEEVELTRFKNNLSAVKDYKQGKDYLVQSGLLNLLRIFARPFINDGGANPNYGVYNAAFCQGYNQCLDDIVYFEEKYIDTKIPASGVRADFGGLSLAVAKGLLTEAEVKKVKDGNRRS